MNQKKITQKKTFHKMTKMQKRVAIAKDVLEQLKTEKILARSGRYFVAKEKLAQTINFAFYNAEDQPTQAQEILLKMPRRNCRVCAIGAIFVAKARIFNEATTELLIDCKKPMVNNLNDYFSLNELNRIECLFEWALGHWSRVSSKVKLKAIMTSIIKNKGKFDEDHATKVLVNKEY